MKKKFVKVCPRCGSNDVFRPIGPSAVSPEYFCRNCNFHSTLFSEVSRVKAKSLSKRSLNFPKYREEIKDSNIIWKIITILVILGIFYLFFSLIFKFF